MAIDKALQIVSATNSGNVPNHIKNGNPDYKYPHNYKNAYVKQQYLPDNIKNAKNILLFFINLLKLSLGLDKASSKVAELGTIA